MYIVLSHAEIDRYFDGYDLERIEINGVVIFRRSMNTASFVSLV
jgi:hypothetical protein